MKTFASGYLERLRSEISEVEISPGILIDCSVKRATQYVSNEIYAAYVVALLPRTPGAQREVGDWASPNRFWRGSHLIALRMMISNALTVSLQWKDHQLSVFIHLRDSTVGNTIFHSTSRCAATSRSHLALPTLVIPEDSIRGLLIIIIEILTVVNFIHEKVLRYIPAHTSKRASLSLQLAISLMAFFVLFAIKAPAKAAQSLKFIFSCPTSHQSSTSGSKQVISSNKTGPSLIIRYATIVLQRDGRSRLETRDVDADSEVGSEDVLCVPMPALCGTCYRRSIISY